MESLPLVIAGGVILDKARLVIIVIGQDRVGQGVVVIDAAAELLIGRAGNRVAAHNGVGNRGPDPFGADAAAEPVSVAVGAAFLVTGCGQRIPRNFRIAQVERGTVSDVDAAPLQCVVDIVLTLLNHRVFKHLHVAEHRGAVVQHGDPAAAGPSVGRINVECVSGNRRIRKGQVDVLVRQDPGAAGPLGKDIGLARKILRTTARIADRSNNAGCLAAGKVQTVDRNVHIIFIVKLVGRKLFFQTADDPITPFNIRPVVDRSHVKGAVGSGGVDRDVAAGDVHIGRDAKRPVCQGNRSVGKPVGESDRRSSGERADRGIGDRFAQRHRAVGRIDRIFERGDDERSIGVSRAGIGRRIGADSGIRRQTVRIDRQIERVGVDEIPFGVKDRRLREKVPFQTDNRVGCRNLGPEIVFTVERPALNAVPVQDAVVNVVEVGDGGIGPVVIRDNGVGNLRIGDVELEIPEIRVVRLVVGTGRIDRAVAGNVEVAHIDDRPANRRGVSGHSAVGQRYRSAHVVDN